MAHYLIVDDDRRIIGEATAKSAADAVSQQIPSAEDADGLSLEVYRVIGIPHRVTFVVETVRKLVVE